jgi:hypothetical protein
VARTKSNNYYAIYRGDEFLAHGYCEDLAVKFNVEEKTIREYAHISHYKRIQKMPNPEKRILAVKVDELSLEDLKPINRKRCVR